MDPNSNKIHRMMQSAIRNLQYPPPHQIHYTGYYIRSTDVVREFCCASTLGFYPPLLSSICTLAQDSTLTKVPP